MNKLLEPTGLKLIPSRHDLLYYQHDYGPDGYARYRALQIEANRRKLDWVWADQATLEAIAKDIEANGRARKGLCHGARNGWEVEWLAKRLNCPVIGTDISPTADQFPNMVQHDFHERRPDFVGAFSFIYSNSLDQAFDPRKALEAWTEQLTPDGRIYIEHTHGHSAAGASEMDPFGAHPLVMPGLFFQWGKGKYRLSDILEVEGAGMTTKADTGTAPSKGKVWVFVLSKEHNES